MTTQLPEFSLELYLLNHHPLLLVVRSLVPLRFHLCYSLHASSLATLSDQNSTPLFDSTSTGHYACVLIEILGELDAGVCRGSILISLESKLGLA